MTSIRTTTTILIAAVALSLAGAGLDLATGPSWSTLAHFVAMAALAACAVTLSMALRTANQHINFLQVQNQVLEDELVKEQQLTTDFFSGHATMVRPQ